MSELMEAIERAALENIVNLLRDENPLVRLEASLAILDRSAEAYEAAWDDGESEEGARDAADYAEIGEFDPADDQFLESRDDLPEEIGEADEEALARRQALAAVPDTALLPATEENMERVMARLAEAEVGVDAPVEAMPPGFKPGNSGVGSGERNPNRSGGRKRKHGRR
jgi:hypothetical protein